MSATETKDHLLGLLQVDDPSERLDNCETVLTVLEHTLGLWSELGYAYKGVDIIERYIYVICDEAKQQCGHHKRHERVRRILEKAWKLSPQYRIAQMNHLHVA